MKCKKEFHIRPSRIGENNYCSKKCMYSSPLWRKAISDSRLGDKNWSKRPEARERVRQFMLGKDRGGNVKECKTCGKKFKDCPSNSTVNCSKKCSSEYFSQIKGELHHSWKGGLTPIHLKERRGIKYKQWRTAVFERDDYICQKCGQRGGKLQADHNLPFAYFPDLRFEILNGQTLCIKCHREKTKIDLKINY